MKNIPGVFVRGLHYVQQAGKLPPPPKHRAAPPFDPPGTVTLEPVRTPVMRPGITRTDIFFHKGLILPTQCFYGIPDRPEMIFQTGLHPPIDIDVSGLTDEQFRLAASDHAQDQEAAEHGLRLGRTVFYGGGAVSSSKDIEQTLNFANQWPMNGLYPEDSGWVYVIDTRAAVKHFDAQKKRYADSNNMQITQHRYEHELQWWGAIPRECVIEAHEVKRRSRELTDNVVQNSYYRAA